MVFRTCIVAAVISMMFSCETTPRDEHAIHGRPPAPGDPTADDFYQTDRLYRGTVGRDAYEGGVPDRTTIEHDIEPGGISSPQSQVSPEGSPGEVLFDPSAVETIDQRFIKQAFASSLFEVQSSRIALQRNVDARTHQLAQLLIDDHRRINVELEVLAARLGAQLPRVMPPNFLGQLNHLRDLDGHEFAKDFLQMQLQAHQEAIALFDQQSREGQDTDLRGFAMRTLPMLQDHLRRLQQYQSSSPAIIDPFFNVP